MAVTDAQLLDAARTALHSILSGEAQSYTISGRVYTALNINDLRAMIRELEHTVNTASRRPRRAGFGHVSGAPR